MMPFSRMTPNNRWLWSIVISLSVLMFAPGAEGDDLTGCWSGTWQSCSTGHQGPLQAEFVQLCDGNYEVHFRGRFFKVIPFRYSIVMSAVEENGVVHLSGSKYLGRMFGTFTFSAQATASEFHADYFSSRDSGKFTLRRGSY